MPANLTPEYKAAEAEYRQTKDPQAKLACLEKMLTTLPKHKGTEKMQADIRRRIKQLKEDLQSKSGPKGFSIKVAKEGTAQVVLVGAPNAGKSALLEVATNARTESADHPFSTRSPVPGMLIYENLQFQLVDLPPISNDYMEPWVTDLVRNADAALWVIDAADTERMSKVNEVNGLLATKKIQLVGPNAALSPGHDPIRRIWSAAIATKMDEPAAEEGLQRLQDHFEPVIPVIPLSALGDTDFSYLGRALFELTHVIRVYSKTPGKDADLSRPFVLQMGDRLIDFARMVHKDFAEQMQFARIWGDGKFEGQRIQRDQELYDGDIVELHM